jgi:hypothetical protein
MNRISGIAPDLPADFSRRPQLERQIQRRLRVANLQLQRLQLWAVQFGQNLPGFDGFSRRHQEFTIRPERGELTIAWRFHGETRVP